MCIKLSRPVGDWGQPAGGWGGFGRGRWRGAAGASARVPRALRRGFRGGFGRGFGGGCGAGSARRFGGGFGAGCGAGSARGGAGCGAGFGASLGAGFGAGFDAGFIWDARRAQFGRDWADIDSVTVQTAPAASLETLVELYDGDVATYRDEIRGLLKTDPQAFLDGLIRALRSNGNPRGIQYVAGLLLAGDYLFGVLANPSLTRQEGAALTRAALQVDSMADVGIAKRLAGEASHLTKVAVMRLMEILDEVSDGNRIMPWLLRLMRQSEPQVRSKAVLMIGRASRSVRWLHSRLGDGDPRARANAVEALWGIETPEAKAFLRMASADNHGRVAANALLGLYSSGDCWMIPELIKMTRSEEPMFRASAAWAMGETGDIRFVENLRHMVCDPNSVVRKRVLSALGRLKKAAAQARQGEEWRVGARLMPPIAGARQIWLDAAGGDGAAPPHLLPTRFLVTENGQAVNAYHVEERPTKEAIAVSFLVPCDGSSETAPWVKGALDCLLWKRSSDLWRAVYFRDTAETSEARYVPPPYSNNTEVITAALKSPSTENEPADFWRALRGMAEANGGKRGALRWVIYCPTKPGTPPEASEIIAAAAASQVSAIVIAGDFNSTLEELCRRTRGRFQIAAPGADLSKLVQDAYLTLRPRFAISYQPLEQEASSIHIRVSNGEGWGETDLTL